MREGLIRRSDAVALCDFYKGDYDAAAKIRYELLNSEMTVPAVDAVEVCRCADCVHFEPFRRHDGFCKIDGMLHDNDFFCKNGQRREDASNA